MNSNTKPPGNTAKQAVVALCVLAAVLLVIFVIRGAMAAHQHRQLDEAAADTANEAAKIDVVDVKRANALDTIELPGSASPFYETTVFARTSGYLKVWKHDIGDRVKNGDLLAEIETPELDDQLTAANAKVLELTAEVKLAEVAAKFAKISFDRWNANGPEGVVSQQEKDSKATDLESADAHIDAAKADLLLGQSEVHRLQTLESFKRVLAPFDGVITSREVDIGDLVTAGSTASTTPLFHIAQYDQLRVFVEVPQSLSYQIPNGLPVIATVPGVTQMYNGRVDRNAAAIDPTGRMLRVEALIDNKDLALLPGTYLQVQFQTHHDKPPLQIPAAALIMRSKGPAVAVVNSDNTINFRPIVIEKDQGDLLNISQGLSDGDRVALNVGQDLIDGSHISPSTPGQPDASATEPK